MYRVQRGVGLVLRSGGKGVGKGWRAPTKILTTFHRTGVLLEALKKYCCTARSGQFGKVVVEY